MTCIVGLEHDSKVYIGADSAAVSGWQVRQTRLPKVFKRGEFLIGYTTSFRMGQLLEYHLEVRPRESGENDVSFIVCAFVEAVRKCLKDGGFTKVENNEEEGGEFLVGYGKSLYRICSDFQVAHVYDGFDAIGSGAEYALGAMKALSHLSPLKRIAKSLKIAAHFCGGVCKPFVVVKL